MSIAAPAQGIHRPPRLATVFVALADASDKSKAQADYACRQVMIEPCEAAWDELVAANVTVTADTTDKKKGSASVKFAVLDAVPAATILATEAITSKNLSSGTKLLLWVKSSVNTLSGDLQLLLDDHASCVSPVETINLPALTANVWRRVRLVLANPNLDTAIISVGLKYVTDLGACNLWLDDIKEIFADDVTIAAAIASLPVDGGSIAFSEGEAHIDTQIDFISNLDVGGQGLATNFVLTADNGTSMFRILSKANVTLHDFIADGDKLNNPTAAYGINFNLSDNVKVERVEVKNFSYHNLVFGGCTNIWVDKFTGSNAGVVGVGGAGLAFGNQGAVNSDGAHLSNIVCIGNNYNFGFDGTQNIEGVNLRSVDGKLADSPGYGFDIERNNANIRLTNLSSLGDNRGFRITAPDTNVIKNLQIKNYYCYDADDYGFALASAGTGTIRDSDFDDIICEECDGNGVAVGGNTQKCHFGRVTAKNNGQDATLGTTERCGVKVSGAAVLHNDFKDVLAYDDQGTPTQQYGTLIDAADWNTFKDVKGSGNAQWDFLPYAVTDALNSSFGELITAQQAFDLSGAAVRIPVFTCPCRCYLGGYKVAYKEASSADAGVALKIGRYNYQLSLLTANAAAAQKVCAVADGTKFWAGEAVTISDSAASEANTIDTISGNNLTMLNNLANAYTVANAGKVEGSEDDDDHFELVTSEVSKSLGYVYSQTARGMDSRIAMAGDIITLACAGGKVGTGEVIMSVWIMPME